jgi:ABC-type nitrate/sulfonate/bicarbonate transport system substrate-binding protein
VTSRAYLKKNPDVVKRFFMAMATAVHEYKHNPDLAVKLTQKFLDVKDAGNAKAAYEAYVKVYPEDLQVSLPGISLVLQALAEKEPKAKSVKPEQLVDTTTLDELAREGFFTKLRRGS